MSPQNKNRSDNLSMPGINQISLDPNNYREADKFFNRYEYVPNVSLFDTFISEEKYSHFVHRKFPDCLKV